MLFTGLQRRVSIRMALPLPPALQARNRLISAFSLEPYK
jgi:hypothetical protein